MTFPPGAGGGGGLLGTIFRIFAILFIAGIVFFFAIWFGLIFAVIVTLAAIVLLIYISRGEYSGSWWR